MGRMFLFQETKINHAFYVIFFLKHMLGKCLPSDGLCADNETCIGRQLFCDGMPHCPNGTDENKCGKNINLCN